MMAWLPIIAVVSVIFTFLACMLCRGGNPKITEFHFMSLEEPPPPKGEGPFYWCNPCEQQVYKWNESTKKWDRWCDY